MSLSSKNRESRLRTACSAILPTQDVSEMGRRLSMLGVFPGLGMRTVTAVFQAKGTFPFFQISFISSVRYSTDLSSKLRNVLFEIPSAPDADRPLSPCRARRISSTPNSASRKVLS